MPRVVVGISLSDGAYALLAAQAARNGVSPTMQARLHVIAALPAAARAAEAAQPLRFAGPALRDPGKSDNREHNARVPTKSELRRQLAEAVKNTGGVKP